MYPKMCSTHWKWFASTPLIVVLKKYEKKKTTIALVRECKRARNRGRTQSVIRGKSDIVSIRMGGGN
jgi:hypothetical protein